MICLFKNVNLKHLKILDRFQDPSFAPLLF